MAASGRDEQGRLRLADVQQILGVSAQRGSKAFFRAEMGRRIRREAEERAKRVGRHAPVTTGKNGANHYADEAVALAYAAWASPAFALHLIGVYQRHGEKVGAEGLSLWELMQSELGSLHELSGVASTSGRHLARYRELKKAQTEVIDGLANKMTPGLFELAQDAAEPPQAEQEGTES